MSGVDENRHFLRSFINTYRNLPVLWDTSLRDYTNRDKRAEAYLQLVPIYRYLKRDANVEDVKKKINTLRTNYRKELKVVESARRTGVVHQSRCWTFHELDFLRNTEKFLAVNPPSKSDESSCAFNDNSQTQSSFIEASYNVKPMLGNSSFAHPAPCISEMFQKSFGHTPRSTPHSPATGDYPPSPTHETAKRQRLTSPAPPAVMAQNPDELLNIACDYLSSTFPEEESIARTWTHKLKRMQREQRLLAEKFINEILFEGESGTLHRGSVQMHTYAPYVRYEEHAKSQSPSIHTSTAPSATPEGEVAKPLAPSDGAAADAGFVGSYN